MSDWEPLSAILERVLGLLELPIVAGVGKRDDSNDGDDLERPAQEPHREARQAA